MDRGLLLIGHGSAGRPAPFGDLAQAVRARGFYGEVACGLVKQGPPLSEVLDSLSTPHVDVLPLFLGNGHYTDTVIPKALGPAKAGRTVNVLPPAGHHPTMPAVVSERAIAAAVEAGFEPKTTSLILVAHGSRRGDGSAAGRRIAAALEAEGCFAEIALAFLEEFPHLGQWRQLVQGHDVLVQPLMMAAGAHLERDIPALLRLAPGEDRRVAVSGPLGEGIGLLGLISGWCPTNT